MNRETDGKQKVMGAGPPGTTSQSGRHMKEETQRETLGEPDDTPQMEWPERETHEGRQVKRDIWRAGHH